MIREILTSLIHRQCKSDYLVASDKLKSPYCDGVPRKQVHTTGSLYRDFHGENTGFYIEQARKDWLFIFTFCGSTFFYERKV